MAFAEHGIVRMDFQCMSKCYTENSLPYWLVKELSLSKERYWLNRRNSMQSAQPEPVSLVLRDSRSHRRLDQLVWCSWRKVWIDYSFPQTPGSIVLISVRGENTIIWCPSVEAICQLPSGSWLIGQSLLCSLKFMWFPGVKIKLFRKFLGILAWKSNLCPSLK